MDIVEQLKRDEGNVGKVYSDTVGKATIGVGFNLTDVGLSQEEIDFILTGRLAALEKQLQEFAWYSSLDEVRQKVLVNMAYNMGVHKLLNFPSMIHFLTVGDWANASAQMMNSVWAGQVGERAKRLAMQMQTGSWV